MSWGPRPELYDPNTLARLPSPVTTFSFDYAWLTQPTAHAEPRAEPDQASVQSAPGAMQSSTQTRPVPHSDINPNAKIATRNLQSWWWVGEANSKYGVGDTIAVPDDSGIGSTEYVIRGRFCVLRNYFGMWATPCNQSSITPAVVIYFPLDNVRISTLTKMIHLSLRAWLLNILAV